MSTNRVKNRKKNYQIITKRGLYEYRHLDEDGVSIEHEKEGLDKTFWVKDLNTGSVKRFSVYSAPKWVMEIYYHLVNEKEIPE